MCHRWARVPVSSTVVGRAGRVVVVPAGEVAKRPACGQRSQPPSSSKSAS